MRVKVGKIKEDEVWNEVHEGLESFVRGIVPREALSFPAEYLPGGYLAPRFEIVSDSFTKWATDFLKNTKDFEWFIREYAGFSWAASFLTKMQEWETKHPNPVLKSQDVATLFERIMTLKRLVLNDFLLEKNYDCLRIDNFVAHYKAIVAGLLAMGFFSIFMPLIILLVYPSDGRYYFWICKSLFSIEVSLIAAVSLIGFILASALVTILLFRTATRSNE
jgi:hypothetical protein